MEELKAQTDRRSRDRSVANPPLTKAIDYMLDHWDGLTRVPRRRPARAGHQHRRAADPADCNRKKELAYFVATTAAARLGRFCRRCSTPRNSMASTRRLG